MKLNIQILIIATLLFSIFAQEPTTLIYFVEYEDEQAEDYIEISLKIEAESRSLVEAISTAGKVGEEISVLSNEYCKEYTKKGKGDCKQAVEIGKHQIKSVYQMVRKEATFSTFVVSHDVTVRVFNPENIGFLVDSFLKYNDLTLEGFEWVPLEEVDSEEAAVKQGVEEGEQLCQQVGLTLSHIIDIDQIQEEKAPAESEDEQQEEEQPDITIYRFKVECAASKTKKK